MCGIFAYLGKSPGRSALLAAVSAIRHRGQDGFGFWLSRGAGGVPHISHFRQAGAASINVLSPVLEIGDASEHHSFVAHWRYGTRGGMDVEGAQPLLLDQGRAALVHNGQFSFSDQREGWGGTDTQFFKHRLAEKQRRRLIDRITQVLETTSGAYTIVAAGEESLIVARDPFGFRPFFYGIYPGGVAFASETTALEAIGCEKVEEVKPGERMEWFRDGWVVWHQSKKEKKALCAFEPVYFHGPDGLLNGISVKEHRLRLGARLAEESGLARGRVVSVPRSADDFAAGYARKLGLDCVPAIQVCSDVQRTFIQNPLSRPEMIRRKYRIDPSLVREQVVTIVDDSLVRGATMRHLAREMRQAGAQEIHVRIGSPPFSHPCYYGINVPDPSELISHQKSRQAIVEELGLDSLSYLSVEGLENVLGSGLCTGCFSGQYPEEKRYDFAQLMKVATR